ncbi:hypothetical protein H1D32_13850 [Anaerobacillus sp. CMMVII]|uniref:hypothetical protein n=1 Tax=Anaerobacillus sp. CMMVII TaxID=2755588 RepID=UPI0021B74259|nr:hypothetical protein [Anaerobacillus sp. CMMVII]MCT8138725.1 hypothetical protein [Anaerobacillus sp. CMMVII]
MERIKQSKLLYVVIVATLLLTSINSLNVYAEDETEGEACTHMEQVKYQHKAIKPHFNFYYQLLAEKYAPKHVKVLKDVITEREALFKKYRELVKSGKDVGDFYDEAWLKKHDEIQTQFLDAVEKRDDAALKKIVPQVIEHQKELNVLLKKRLKELK